MSHDPTINQMTVRDVFAVNAMLAILPVWLQRGHSATGNLEDNSVMFYGDLAAEAYTAADAMMLERLAVLDE